MLNILKEINTESQGGLKGFPYGIVVADTKEKQDFVKHIEQLLQDGHITCKISNKPTANGYLTYVIAEVCITEKGKEFLANNLH